MGTSTTRCLPIPCSDGDDRVEWGWGREERDDPAFWKGRMENTWERIVEQGTRKLVIVKSSKSAYGLLMKKQLNFEHLQWRGVWSTRTKWESGIRCEHQLLTPIDNQIDEIPREELSSSARVGQNFHQHLVLTLVAPPHNATHQGNARADATRRDGIERRISDESPHLLCPCQLSLLVFPNWRVSRSPWMSEQKSQPIIDSKNTNEKWKKRGEVSRDLVCGSELHRLISTIVPSPLPFLWVFSRHWIIVIGPWRDVVVGVCCDGLSFLDL